MVDRGSTPGIALAGIAGGTGVAGGLSSLRGRSVRPDSAGVVAELRERIGQPGLSAVLFFAGAGVDFESLAAGMAGAFDCPTMGCTTAGEISSEHGLGEGSVVAVSLASARLVAHAEMLDAAMTTDVGRVSDAATALMGRRTLGAKAGSFVLTLCDGVSMCEERVAAGVFGAGNGCGLVGGSAGGVDSGGGRIALDGRTAREGVVACVVETAHPFEIFHTHHYEPSDRRLVITAADPSTRRVLEIDGMPAADGYAMVIGVEAGAVGLQTFATSPLMLTIDGRRYLRSVMTVNADRSLTFSCAIEAGLVMRVGRPMDLAGGVRECLDGLRGRVPGHAVTIGFDCMMRRMEITGRGLGGEVGVAVRDAKLVGFSTFGEQYNGLHVNQTLTGVAIGGAA